MDMILPVRTAIFPSRHPARRSLGRSASAAQAESASREDPISLRPSTPLANIPMLLEILSEAGEPANGHRDNVFPFRRRTEDNRAKDVVQGRQYSFDFEE